MSCCVLRNVHVAILQLIQMDEILQNVLLANTEVILDSYVGM